MTKIEFEKKVKEVIADEGAKVVDMNTTFETVGIFANTFMTIVIAIKNHIAYSYSAWQEDENVTVNFRGCLGL